MDGDALPAALAFQDGLAAAPGQGDLVRSQVCDPSIARTGAEDVDRTRPIGGRSEVECQIGDERAAHSGVGVDDHRLLGQHEERFLVQRHNLHHQRLLEGGFGFPFDVRLADQPRSVSGRLNPDRFGRPGGFGQRARWAGRRRLYGHGGLGWRRLRRRRRLCRRRQPTRQCGQPQNHPAPHKPVHE